MFSQIITRSMATMWKLRDSWHTQASDLSLWLNEKTGSSEAARLLQVGRATHLVGGHLLWGSLQYLCIFSLAWLSLVCFGWSAQKRQFYIYCAKCLSNPTNPCVDSVLHEILSPCVLTCVTCFSLTLLAEGHQPQVTVHSFSECFNSSKLVQIIQQYIFQQMCPLLSFCGQVVLKSISCATSLV